MEYGWLKCIPVTAYFNKKRRRENRIRIDGFSCLDLSLSMYRKSFTDNSSLIMFYTFMASGLWNWLMPLLWREYIDEIYSSRVISILVGVESHV